MSSNQNVVQAHFPTVRGSNLSRKDYVLPMDIEGDLALMMIAFRQFQQAQVDTWIPIAKDLSQQFPAFVFYELPTIDRLPRLARMFIDGGMRAGIPDETARNTTITLYLDKSAFRRALDISTEDTITVLLVDKEGNLLWREQGPATTEAEQSLRTVIENVLEH
jgi:hypothetical protein